MVLSPIEPVAPSTVMLRTASFVALLFRNGTALIVSPKLKRSPNQKAAADAIETAAHQAQNRRQHNGRNIAVEAVQQAAMSGNDVAGILDAEAPLHRGFEEITELRGHRQHGADQHDRYNFARSRGSPSGGDHQAADEATDGAGPGL